MLLVAPDMLANKRQARRERGNDTISTDDNIAMSTLATPLLAGPAAITSVMAVASSPEGKLDMFIGYSAMTAVMLTTTIILIIASLLESYINSRVTLVFFRITAIILATLSIQYINEWCQSAWHDQNGRLVAVTRSSSPRLVFLAQDQPLLGIL